MQLNKNNQGAERRATSQRRAGSGQFWTTSLLETSECKSKPTT
jgi:hypothetical protein